MQQSLEQVIHIKGMAQGVQLSVAAKCHILPDTYHRDRRSVDSSLASGTINGAGQW